MNDWSDLSSDWQRLEPDLTPLIKATERRGRWLHRYFRFQLIGSVVVLPPVLIWAFWVASSASQYGMLCSAIGIVAGWWRAAWPIWADVRRPDPPARQRAVLVSALRHIRSGRRLAALEMGVGLSMATLMGLIWLFEPLGRGELLVVLAGTAFSLAWFAASWRYRHKLRREADALLGREGSSDRIARSRRRLFWLARKERGE